MRQTSVSAWLTSWLIVGGHTARSNTYFPRLSNVWLALCLNGPPAIYSAHRETSWIVEWHIAVEVDVFSFGCFGCSIHPSAMWTAKKKKNPQRPRPSPYGVATNSLPLRMNKTETLPALKGVLTRLHSILQITTESAKSSPLDLDLYVHNETTRMKQYGDRAVLDRTDKVHEQTFYGLLLNTYVTPMLNLIISNQDIFEINGKEKEMGLQSMPSMCFLSSQALFLELWCNFSPLLLIPGTE